jgi:hypothetical protein
VCPDGAPRGAGLEGERGAAHEATRPSEMEKL